MRVKHSAWEIMLAIHSAWKNSQQYIPHGKSASNTSRIVPTSRGTRAAGSEGVEKSAKCSIVDDTPQLYHYHKINPLYQLASLAKFYQKIRKQTEKRPKFKILTTFN
jgi:hypothetical protein